MMYASIMAEEGALVYDLMPSPDLVQGEVIVKVHALTANVEDVLYRNDRYSIQKDLPHILGSNAVGEIVAVADDVKDWSIGNRVVFVYDSLGLERNGTYADYVAVPARYLGRIPQSMDYREAVKVGYALCRAWSGLTYQARIRKREVVVINGASTPLGLASMAIAQWKEATIVAIDKPERASQLKEAGANIVLDENSDDLLSLILTITDDISASLVVDLLGAESLMQSIEFLAFDGRVLSLATYNGDIAHINLQDLMSINGSIVTGSDMLKAGDIEKLLAMVADSSLSLPVDSILALSQANDAHQALENDDAFGLIVLIPDALYHKANSHSIEVELE